jgi:hypothetical protein
MLVKLILAVIILVYAALQTDINRKCKNKGAVPASEASLLQFVNVTMLVLSSVAVLFCGYQLLVPSAQKAMVSSYF